MDIFRIVVFAHIAAGSLALIFFWTAGLMKKGTPTHRKIGQFYLLAMMAVVLSGVPLVVRALMQSHLLAAAFLGFLLLLVSTSCWASWRAIRDRRDRLRYFGPIYRLLVGSTFIAGISVSALGLTAGSALLSVFGLVGVLIGVNAVRGWRRSVSDPKWWLKEHYGAMIGNGVATHIAFLGIGLRRLLPMFDGNTLQLVAFTAPLAVSVLAGWWLNKRYGGARPETRKAAPNGLAMS